MIHSSPSSSSFDACYCCLSCGSPPPAAADPSEKLLQRYFLSRLLFLLPFAPLAWAGLLAVTATVVVVVLPSNAQREKRGKDQDQE